MQLTWYGTASLILREGNTAIAFDPFCGFYGSLYPKGELPYEQEFRKVTNVFITHGHFDHIAHIPKIYKDTPLKLYCTQTPYKTLIKQKISPKYMQAVCPGEKIKVDPFTVTTYQSRHCRFDFPLIAKTVFRPRTFRHPVHFLRLIKALLQYPESGEILFYEVLCGDMRIQIMGSLNLCCDVEYPTGADLLILPFQGRSDLEEYGLKLVQKLKPKEVLLDHYDDTFSPLSDTIDTQKFEELLCKREGIPCRAMIKGVDYLWRNERGAGEIAETAVV